MKALSISPRPVSSSSPVSSRAGRCWALVSLASIGCVLWTTGAFAAPADSNAQQLADTAIFTDYLQLDFKAGEKKLQQALALCKKRGCSPTVHAQVHRDLAVIYITGMKRVEEGEKLLVKALELDPDVALDADLTTPELLKAFESAKAQLRERGKPQRGTRKRPGTKEKSEDEKPSEQPEVEAADPAEEQESDSTTGATIGSEDCPPDFPGCEALGEGDEEDAGTSTEDEDTGVSHWLSVAIQQDFLRFSGQSGVCLNSGPEELSCYQEGDNYQDPDGVLGSGGEVNGGFRLATTRLLIGYERDLFLPNLRLGAWLGYAIGGGPAEPGGPSFVPFHAEVRGKYRFPIGGFPLVPFASVGAGLAQVDSSVTTEIIDQNLSTGVGERQSVTVWQKTGTTFFSFGGGALYPLGEESSLSAQLQWTALFPSSGGAVAFSAAYTHGF